MTVVRPATPADANAMAFIEANNEIARVGVDGARAPWNAAAIRATLLARGRAWVALVDDAVVGHIITQSVDDEAELLAVGVAPEARRRGVARALLSAAHAAWVAAGVRSATLEVRVGNGPAIALYRAFGWFAAGVRRGYYADGEDAIVMRWEIG
jgi:ribosomal-protein-alanine N-acetyltransferase